MTPRLPGHSETTGRARAAVGWEPSWRLETYLNRYSNWLLIYNVEGEVDEEA